MYSYLSTGIEYLDLKLQSLRQLSGMVSFNDQKMGFECEHKNLPTINFLDVLSVSSYGKLR